MLGSRSSKLAYFAPGEGFDLTRGGSDDGDHRSYLVRKSDAAQGPRPKMSQISSKHRLFGIELSAKEHEYRIFPGHVPKDVLTPSVGRSLRKHHATRAPGCADHRHAVDVLIHDGDVEVMAGKKADDFGLQLGGIIRRIGQLPDKCQWKQQYDQPPKSGRPIHALHLIG